MKINVTTITIIMNIYKQKIIKVKLEYKKSFKKISNYLFSREIKVGVFFR